jgi:fumarate reductase subunit C
MSAAAPAGAKPRSYRRPVPATWWLRNRRYVLYMLRDFSPVPFALWLIWFLVEIARLRSGPAGYHPHVSPLFIAFSIVAFAFALLHSVTFLMLSGVVLSIPIGGWRPSPSIIRAFNFGIWAIVSAVIVAGYIYLGSLS